MKKNLIYLLLLGVSLSYCSKPDLNLGYAIDPSIQTEVNLKCSKEQGMQIGSINLIVKEYDEISNGDFAIEETIESFTATILFEDTVQIVCFDPIVYPYGANIRLTRNTFFLEHFVKSGYPEYRLNKNDSLSGFLSIPTNNEKLTLTKQPMLREGEIIKGKLTFEGNEHFIQTEDSIDHKLSTKMEIYFTTEPLMKYENQLKEFEKRNR